MVFEVKQVYKRVVIQMQCFRNFCPVTSDILNLCQNQLGSRMKISYNAVTLYLLYINIRESLYYMFQRGLERLFRKESRF